MLCPQCIGLGAFYYFVSVPIIGVMNYTGYWCQQEDVLAFFVTLAASMAAGRCACVLTPTRARRVVESVAPLSAVLCALAILLAGLAALGPWRLPALIACAALTGLVCSAVVGLWAQSPSLCGFRASAFSVSPALCWAVAFYVAYRMLQFFSSSVAAGWQVAVPLVGMMALLVAYSPDYQAIEGDPLKRRSFLLLGVVAGMVAVCAGAIGYASGYPGARDRAAFTPMVFVELLGVVVIAGLCLVMGRAGARMFGRGARHRALGACVLALPPFVLGCLAGIVPTDGDTSNFLWEASIWVLLITVFVYGMRTSLFAMRGLAIGLMWEAWCVGQSVSHAAILADGAAGFAVAAGIATAYLLATPAWVAMGPSVPMSFDESGDGDRRVAASAPRGGETPVATPSSGADDLAAPDACTVLAGRFALSGRELEVLVLLGEGRSAKYISERLVISFNTARSHIRHIYEKLDVHSRQELIDLIQRQR